MPVENEDKYVLRLDREGELRKALSDLSPPMAIEQFYLNRQVRYRRSQEPGGTPLHEFTFKQRIEGRLLEQNIEVSPEDYGLASKAAVSRIDKVRFKFPGEEPGAAWDVDVMLDAPAAQGGKAVFAMAECEYPEGGTHAVPDVLMPFVALAVPREHAELFSNARLSEPGYAATVLERYLAGWRG